MTALPTPPSDALRWRRVAALASLVWALGREAFVALQPTLIAAGTRLDPAQLTPWARDFVQERDGLELPVAVLGLHALLLLVGALSWALPRLPLRRWWPWEALGLAAFLRLLLQVRSTEFEAPSWARAGVVAGLAAVMVALAWVGERAPRWVVTTFLVAAFVTAGTFVLGSIVPASAWDYAYFDAPALLWLQGERLGSFYVQYDLAHLLLFAGALKAGLALHETQVLVAVTVVAWLALDVGMARAVLQRRGLAVLFVAAVFVFRFLAFSGHPSGFPQASVLRLDLWVPLLWAAARWGFVSPRTGTAFAIAWVLDDLFGLLFVGVYVGAVVVAAVGDAAARLPRRWGPALLPLALAVVVRLLLVGSLGPASGQRYAAAGLGFLPISPVSLFWPLGAVLLATVAVSVAQRAEARARLALFACALVAVQWTYFFGRSHEHNLLSLGASWLVVLFLLLDRVADLAPRRALLGAGAVVLAGVAFVPAERLDFKRSTYRRHWRTRTLLEPHALEAQAALVRRHYPNGSPDVVLLDLADGPLNAMVGFRQWGPLAPMAAALTMDEFSQSVARALATGRQVLCIDPACAGWVAELNAPALVTKRGTTLRLRMDGDLQRVEVQARGPAEE